MRWVRAPRFWAGCLAGSGLLALTEATALHYDAQRAGRSSQFGWVLIDRAASDLVWLMVAVAVFAVTERMATAGARTATIARRLAWLGLALAPLYTMWGPFARTAVHGGGFDDFVEALRATPGTTLFWVGILYSITSLAACMVVVSQRSRRHERDSIELRGRLAQAELELLRAQLEPHFLFNALNTIAGLIRTARAEQATTALARLSQLLRYVVEASRHERVPLAWELEFATSYLELQQMRFGPRMQFAIHETAGRGCDVPPLLLQPLIENAVVHGVAPTSAPVRIDVHVAIIDGELRVEIDNTRDIGAPGDADTTGVGLRNTRQRLERLYGDRFVLDAGPESPDRYRVAISLPQGCG